MKKKLLLLALSISALITNNLNAQVAGDFQSAGSGSWNNTSTWARYDGSTWVTPAPTFPTTAEGPVTVLAGHTVDITANISLDSVTIATGATVNINAGVTVTAPTNNAGGAINDINNQGTLNVSGKILATGTGLVKTSGGVTTFLSSSTYEHNENGGSIPTSTWNNGSTCLITGVTTAAPGNANQNFYDFTWNNTGQTAAVNVAWANNTVSGTLRLLSAGATNTVGLRLTNSAATLGAPNTITVGNVIVSSNLLTMTGSGANPTYPSQILALNVLGNMDINGIGSYSLSSGTSTNSSITTIYGNLTLNSGTTPSLVKGSSAAGATLKLIFAKNGTQTFTNPTASKITSGYVFEVASGTTLDLNTSIISNGGSTFILNSNAGVICSGPGGFNDNFTSGAQIFSIPGDANFTFNASGPQTVGTKFGAAVSSCNNLTINNNGGTGNDTLKLAGVQGLRVIGNLNLTKGIILPNTTNTLTLAPSATVTGGSNASHVAKRLFRETDNTTPYLFPIGKGAYNPLTVIPQAATPTTFEAEYYNAAYTDVTNFTAPATAVSTNGYHDLGRSSGTADAKVQLTLAGLGVPGGTASSSVGLGHYTAGAWKWEGGFGVVDGSATTGTVESGLVTSFSPFGLVLVPTGTLSPLPLNLLSFAGKLNNNQVELNWLTTNEINTKEFSIERSTNGKSFTSIGYVNAVNASGNNTYNFTDTRVSNSDVFYYRLKQIDIDGAFTYSNIVVIKVKNTKQLIAYPNPASKELNIAFNTATKNTYLKVYNSVGTLISNTAVAVGTTQKNIDVSAFANGIYQFVITDGTNIQKTQVVKIY